MRRLSAFLLLLACLFTPVFSQVGNALHFDGSNDHVVCPLPSVFSNISSNSFTMEAWVYPTGAIFSRIIYAQFATNNFATMSTGGTNNIYFYVVSNGTNYSLATTATLPSNTWTHVAARWTAGTTSVAVFFNGVLQASSPGGTSSTGTSGMLTLGTRPGGAQYFPGAMDEVRIWSTARSQCEIQSNMDRHFTGPQPNLVAYYDFNAGVPSGTNTGITTLTDQSGNTNNGTLNNFALTGSTSNWIASTAGVISSGSAVNGYLQYAYPLVCYNSSYTFPAGPTVLFVTGPNTYTSNLTATNGCDSVIVTTVDAYPLNQVQDTGAVCAGGSYTFPDSSTQTNITSQVIYTSTLVDVHGCDSLIVTTVDVLPSYNYNESAVVCSGGSYTYPDGSFDSNITTQTVHTSLMSTTLGCDSIIVTTVDVMPVYSMAVSDTVCFGGSYMFPDSTFQMNITTQTIHTSAFSSVSGCDSLIVTTLEVFVVDTTVTQSGFTLTANATGGVYQWIDCLPLAALPGQTNASFTPTNSGTYAVILSQNGCTDTSACITVIIEAVGDGPGTGIAVYPNPSNGNFVLEVQGDVMQPMDVSVLNALGQVVYQWQITDAGKHHLKLDDFSAGVYSLRIVRDGQATTMKLVVER